MATKPVFYNRFSKRPPRVTAKLSDVSCVKASFKDEADINNIVKRYQAASYDPRMIEQKQSFYADFSADVDLSAAYAAIDVAQSEFEALPSPVREAFGNDPVQFVDAFKSPDVLTTHRDLFVSSGIMSPSALAAPELSPSPHAASGSPTAQPPVDPVENSS